MSWPGVQQPAQRWRGERGMAMVTGLVLLFAFTSVGVIWLARDVDRKVSHRSVAQSIAFQAARSGAQQLAGGQLRGAGAPVVDERLAESAARATTMTLLDGYGLHGAVVRVSVAGDLVEVEIRIDDPVGSVTGIGAARANTGP